MNYTLVRPFLISPIAIKHRIQIQNICYKKNIENSYLSKNYMFGDNTYPKKDIHTLNFL